MTRRRTFLQEYFNQLPGTWAITRDVVQPTYRTTFAGQATFHPEGTGVLLYEEHGTMTLPDGTAIEGYQSYAYSLQGGALVIDFRDRVRTGQRYVCLSFQEGPEGLVAEAIHQCDPDLYQHQMTWLSPTAFSTTITVKGPRKDYVLNSGYVRTE